MEPRGAASRKAASRSPPTRRRCAKRPIRAPRRTTALHWQTRVEPYATPDTPPELARASEDDADAALSRHRRSALSRPTRAASASCRCRRCKLAARNPLMSRRRRPSRRRAGLHAARADDRARAARAPAARAVRLARIRRAAAGSAARRRSTPRPACGSRTAFLRDASSKSSIRCACARSPSSRCCSPASATRCASPRRCRRASPAAASGTTGSRVKTDDARRRLVLERVLPDLDDTQMPEFATPSARCSRRTSTSCASATSAATSAPSDDERADVARSLGRSAAAAAADPHRRRAEARRRHGRR